MYFRVSMAAQEGHCCVGCGVAMPLEDGNDSCVLFLGHEHAIVSRENPQSCMDCFILPARTREARCRFFAPKRVGAQGYEGPRLKSRRLQRGGGSVLAPGRLHYLLFSLLGFGLRWALFLP